MHATISNKTTVNCRSQLDLEDTSLHKYGPPRLDRDWGAETVRLVPQRKHLPSGQSTAA